MYVDVTCTVSFLLRYTLLASAVMKNQCFSQFYLLQGSLAAVLRLFAVFMHMIAVLETSMRILQLYIYIYIHTHTHAQETQV